MVVLICQSILRGHQYVNSLTRVSRDGNSRTSPDIRELQAALRFLIFATSLGMAWVDQIMAQLKQLSPFGVLAVMFLIAYVEKLNQPLTSLSIHSKTSRRISGSSSWAQSNRSMRQSSDLPNF
jgi:hypothetical protein